MKNIVFQNYPLDKIIQTRYNVFQGGAEMKIKSLSELCKEDYHLQFLSFIEMPQAEKNAAFSCLSLPKKQDLLLYVKDCATEYVTKNKKILRTRPGDVVYVPTGSEYTVRCLHAEENAFTYQINLHLTDCGGEATKLSENILIFSPNGEKVRRKFEKLLALSAETTAFPTESKAIVYEIFALLEKEFSAFEVPPVIGAGAEYIRLHYKEKPQVSFLAGLCYISPEYFRKTFEAAYGEAPAAYINRLRLEKAAEYLIYSDLTVAQIAEELSYATPAHFIKQFKNRFRLTPLAYRKTNM